MDLDSLSIFLNGSCSQFKTLLNCMSSMFSSITHAIKTKVPVAKDYDIVNSMRWLLLLKLNQ